MKTELVNPVPHAGMDSSAGADLIERVMQLRLCVGDGLNDAEFTQLLIKIVRADSNGFSIVCYSDGCVTFAVPPQKLSDWYPADRWLSAEKEEIGRGVAERFDLSLCEPPDRLSYIVPPPRAHHHIELITRWETIAVAHPLYLKIRLFGARRSDRVMWTHHTDLPPAAAIMQELVKVYS